MAKRKSELSEAYQVQNQLRAELENAQRALIGEQRQHEDYVLKQRRIAQGEVVSLYSDITRLISAMEGVCSRVDIYFPEDTKNLRDSLKSLVDKYHDAVQRVLCNPPKSTGSKKGRG